MVLHARSKPFRCLVQNSAFNGLLICHRHISIVSPVIALFPITSLLRLRAILKFCEFMGSGSLRVLMQAR
jgi:hypothetical protein